MAACGSGEDETQRAIQPLEQITANDLQIVTGQTVFVPAYTEIFNGINRQTTDLGVTLAIHNTDSSHPIIILSVEFYNTEGELVRNFAEEPVSLQPLGTTGFVISDDDNSGGFGANFIVEWIAEAPVTEPVIEGIMINTRNQQGLSLITTGRILNQIGPDDSD
jgi:hypothetical protein